MIFVGVDWAEAHHDVHVVQDEDGKRLGGGRLPEGVEGIARFHELVGAHVEDPAEVAIGIETDRGLFVAALVAAGYQVFAVNPMSTSRYRDRHSTSGAKSDPGTPRCWPTWSAPTATTTAPSPVTRDGRGGQGPGPGPPVHDLVPGPPDQRAALHAAGVLPGRPGRFRRPGQRRRPRSAAKSPPRRSWAGRCRVSKIAAALRRGGRQRRIDERAVEIQAALRAPQLRPPPRCPRPWAPRWPPAWP